MKTNAKFEMLNPNFLKKSLEFRIFLKYLSGGV